MKVEELYKKKHELLWGWLAENPEKDKRQWPRWAANGGDIKTDNYCFACQFVRVFFTRYWNEGKCEEVCPCYWGYDGYNNRRLSCKDRDSPYNLWYYSKTSQEKENYAFAVKNAWRVL